MSGPSVSALLLLPVKQKNAATRVAAGHAGVRPSVSDLPVLVGIADTVAGGRCIRLAPVAKVVCPGGPRVVQLSDANYRVVPREISVQCFILFKPVASRVYESLSVDKR